MNNFIDEYKTYNLDKNDWHRIKVHKNIYDQFELNYSNLVVLAKLSGWKIYFINESEICKIVTCFTKSLDERYFIRFNLKDYRILKSVKVDDSFWNEPLNEGYEDNIIESLKIMTKIIANKH